MSFQVRKKSMKIRNISVLLVFPFLDSDSGSGSEYTSLQMFLAAVGPYDWTPKFVREKIDLEALMLLSENDLGDVLGLPLGPRKKLLKAINERRKDMEEPDEIHDNKL